MRKILFRGKRTDTGEWVYGAYLPKSGMICTEKTYPNSTLYIDLFVDRDTVGQFTGMTDKDGKMIFEGDIVNGHNSLHEDRPIYRVVYKRNGFYHMDEDDVAWHPDNIEKVKVIGNIHDNPELLEEE